MSRRRSRGRRSKRGAPPGSSQEGARQEEGAAREGARRRRRRRRRRPRRTGDARKRAAGRAAAGARPAGLELLSGVPVGGVHKAWTGLEVERAERLDRRLEVQVHGVLGQHLALRVRAADLLGPHHDLDQVRAPRRAAQRVELGAEARATRTAWARRSPPGGGRRPARGRRRRCGRRGAPAWRRPAGCSARRRRRAGRRLPAPAGATRGGRCSTAPPATRSRGRGRPPPHARGSWTRSATGARSPRWHARRGSAASRSIFVIRLEEVSDTRGQGRSEQAPHDEGAAHAARAAPRGRSRTRTAPRPSTRCWPRPPCRPARRPPPGPGRPRGGRSPAARPRRRPRPRSGPRPAGRRARRRRLGRAARGGGRRGRDEARATAPCRSVRPPRPGGGARGGAGCRLRTPARGGRAWVRPGLADEQHEVGLPEAATRSTSGRSGDPRRRPGRSSARWSSSRAVTASDAGVLRAHLDSRPAPPPHRSSRHRRAPRGRSGPVRRRGPLRTARGRGWTLGLQPRRPPSARARCALPGSRRPAPRSPWPARAAGSGRAATRRSKAWASSRRSEVSRAARTVALRAPPLSKASSPTTWPGAISATMPSSSLPSTWRRPRMTTYIASPGLAHRNRTAPRAPRRASSPRRRRAAVTGERPEQLRALEQPDHLGLRAHRGRRPATSGLATAVAPRPRTARYWSMPCRSAAARARSPARRGGGPGGPRVRRRSPGG